MGVFDKLKDMQEMRKSAKELQSALSKETIVGTSSNGFAVTIDGNQNVLKVEIPDSLVHDKLQLEKGAKEAFTRALEGLKKLMVSKFSNILKG